VRKAQLILLSIFTVFAITGCSVFYPNAGEKISPVESETPTPSASESGEPSPSESPSATSSKSAAQPVVSFYEITGTTLVIAGEVTNVSENNGECIITFYFADNPVLVERVSAESNVGITQCAPLEVPFSSLPRGSGYAVIEYESQNFEGKSEKFKVEIP